jgi:subtilisin family serine protease
VYIVDSGITANHPEFVGVNVENVYSYDGTFDDINGHGTAIASIIGGNTCSLANSDIKVVKIFGNTPTLQSHLLAAFDTIITHSSANIFPSVVNLSWIIDKNPFIESKIQKLIDNKVTVVCAAGNSGAPIPNVTPASMPDVITVGAYNQDFEPCDFSNYTSGIAVTGGTVNYGSIDVWSPGVNILAASIDGSYHLVSGTSIASAIHSSACAFGFGLDLSMDDPEFMMSTNHVQNLISTPAYLKTLSGQRENILTLQGVYAESVNRISTIFSKPERPAAFVLNVYDTIVAGKPWEEFVWYKMYINSAELEQPLPPGLELKDGFIIGTVDPSYLDGQDYKLFTTKCNAQTVLGENVITDVRILIKKAEEVVAEAIDDPEIIVFLQAGPGCANAPICSGDYCTAPLKFDRCVTVFQRICGCFGM